MSAKPRHTTPQLNKWVRAMVVEHELRPHEAHILKEVKDRVDLNTLSFYASIAQIAEACGYTVTVSEFADKHRGGEVRTLEKCNAVASTLKRLDTLGLIRIAQQGQRRANVYFLNYSAADESGAAPVENASEYSMENTGECSMEYAPEDSRCTPQRPQSSSSVKPPSSTPHQVLPSREIGSTLTRTPEITPASSPEENDDDPDLGAEQIRALIEVSLGKRINGIEEAAA